MSNAHEQWLPIEGYPGYEVSDHGRVRSLDRVVSARNRWGSISHRQTKGRMLKIQKCTNDYLFVALGRNRHALVHRLVARAFVQGHRPDLDVNHLDGRRDNNIPSNLEWVNRSANVQHSYDVLGRKQHKRTIPVSVGGVGYESMLSAAKAIGVCPGSISSALTCNHKVRGMEVSYGVPRA